MDTVSVSDPSGHHQHVYPSVQRPVCSQWVDEVSNIDFITIDTDNFYKENRLEIKRSIFEIPCFQKI